MNICQAIQCPYFDDGKSYRCTRYLYSHLCHLQHYKVPLSSNGYYLAASLPPQQIQHLKQENNRFFLEDPKYAKDRIFQDVFPDVFDESHFQVKALEQP